MGPTGPDSGKNSWSFDAVAPKAVEKVVVQVQN